MSWLGNLAGWMVLTPLTAYRAFHLKHHQTTNREGDPNAPLNSRWMLGVGSLVYATLIHLHAWRNLRGRLLARYLLEMAGMAVFLAALALLLPRSLRDRAWLLPLVIVMILQNIRIVTEHLDLPSGRYHDTWQLVLPGWLSGWLLHYDHHLEHHLRPGLHWHELPGYRARLSARETELGLHRVTLGRYFRDVFLKRPLAADRPSTCVSSAAQRPVDERIDRRNPARRPQLRADAPALASGSEPPAGPRHHGLDAMRGATMALVVVLHAALAYAVVPIPNLIWAVRDAAAQPAFDLLCWWTLGISSPFYLISGFFAVALCESRGLRAFLVNRAQRIVGPFLVAGLTILPATFFIWVFGWLISGRCTTREILRMKFHVEGISAEPLRTGTPLVPRIPGHHAGGVFDRRRAAQALGPTLGKTGTAAGVGGPRVGVAVEAALLGRADDAHPLGRAPRRRPRRDDGPSEFLCPGAVPVVAQRGLFRGWSAIASPAQQPGRLCRARVDVPGFIGPGVRLPRTLDSTGTLRTRSTVRPPGTGGFRRPLLLASHLRVPRLGTGGA